MGVDILSVSYFFILCCIPSQVAILIPHLIRQLSIYLLLHAWSGCHFHSTSYQGVSDGDAMKKTNLMDFP
jgi:hypothetical protein